MVLMRLVLEYSRLMVILVGDDEKSTSCNRNEQASIALMPDETSNNMNALSLWFELYSSNSRMSVNVRGSSWSGYALGILTSRLNLELEMSMSLYSKNDRTTAM